MKSAALAFLVCMFAIESAVVQWEVSGSVSATNKGDVKAEVKVTFKFGGEKKKEKNKNRRSVVNMHLISKSLVNPISIKYIYNPLLCVPV